MWTEHPEAWDSLKPKYLLDPEQKQTLADSKEKLAMDKSEIKSKLLGLMKTACEANTGGNNQGQNSVTGGSSNGVNGKSPQQPSNTVDNVLGNQLADQMKQFMDKIDKGETVTTASANIKCDHCKMQEMQIRIPKKGYKIKNRKRGQSKCSCSDSNEQGDFTPGEPDSGIAQAPTVNGSNSNMKSDDKSLDEVPDSVVVDSCVVEETE